MRQPEILAWSTRASQAVHFFASLPSLTLRFYLRSRPSFGPLTRTWPTQKYRLGGKEKVNKAILVIQVILLMQIFQVFWAKEILHRTSNLDCHAKTISSSFSKGFDLLQLLVMHCSLKFFERIIRTNQVSTARVYFIQFDIPSWLLFPNSQLEK